MRIATRVDGAIAQLARAQHGVVARRQLRALGLGDATISRAIDRGVLVPLHRGVYALGHDALRPEARRLAAVLACGPGAVLSHGSAAAAWGLIGEAGPRFEITTQTAGGRALPRMRVHRGGVDPADRTELDGVPVTTVARTLLDVAATRPPRVLDRAIERAEELRRFDLAELDACLERNRGRRGAGRLRARLADLRPADPRLVRSELERGVLRLIDRHGLPRPAVNLDLHGWEVDLHWPRERVAVELDAWGTHGTRAAFERDHARDLDLQRRGWRVVRISWRQWRREPQAVAEALRAVLRAPPPGRASPTGVARP
ncbi:MAG: type IV toxin-antitoxin system AbiEi family antitoxin domain-containing protein [Solirubrobacteraceae bacterium]|nr:type IV toxin-antitoxin system AbiEi family antitoxin domain-containing protein [Solirubrobacteraceae bacterium]